LEGESYISENVRRHGRRNNKNGKDEFSLHIGLDVFCRFEARGECYATYISMPVAILGGKGGNFV
jgi:hypothetical protein